MEDGELEFDRCTRCNQELTGGSHYHCANCTSTNETSMLGHFFKLEGETHHTFHCKPEDLVEGASV